MKKMKWLGGLAGVLAAAVLASFAVTGCDLELSDKDDRAATASGSDTGSGSGGSNFEDGSVDHPYTLTTSYATTVSGKSGAIDCNKYQPESGTFNKAGKIDWKNPLLGKALTGFTFTADVYMTAGAHYDALLAFYISDNTGDGGFLSIYEDGNIRSNSTAGFFESIGNTEDATTGALTIPATTWTKVAVTVDTEGKVTYYKNGTAVDTSAITGYTGGGNVTWDGLNTYLTSSATNIGVGVGCSWWKSGYVDAGNYLANIKIYSTALTADQVAAIK